MLLIFLKNRKLFTEIDDADFDAVRSFNWKSTSGGKNRTLYATAYIYADNKTYSYLLHRVILGLTDRKVLVDHIDGNGLNNKRDNLRICTHTENMRNRRKNKNNSSGFKGVQIRKGYKVKKYVAEVRYMGKNFRSKGFATPAEAHSEYVRISKALHGEFANAG